MAITTVEAKIADALLTYLGTLTLSQALPIAMPNVDFTPPAGGKYLSAAHLPNATSQVTLGDNGFNRHIGLLQVSVVWPQNAGDIEPKEIAGQVVAHFKRGTVISHDGITLRIVQPPSVAPAIPDPPGYQIPVTIPYMIDAANPS